jgi:phosphoribosyl 1,2-cyclic phosphodiesterase
MKLLATEAFGFRFLGCGGGTGLECSRCGANDAEAYVHQFLQACAIGVDRGIPSVKILILDLLVAEDLATESVRADVVELVAV